MLQRQLLHGRNIDGQIRRAIGEGHPRSNCRPGVQHRGRDGGMVFLHALLEFFRCRVYFLRRQENFGRSAPDHHQRVSLGPLAKLRDVVLDFEGQVVLVRGLLDVRAVEALHVIAIEGGLHRPDGGEKFLGLGEILGREHGRVRRSFIGGIRKKIPAAENQIFERVERHEILDERRAALGPFSQAYGAELRGGAHRLRGIVANQIDAGHEGRRHRAHPHSQDTQVSLGRCNRSRPAHSLLPPLIF